MNQPWQRLWYTLFRFDFFYVSLPSLPLSVHSLDDLLLCRSSDVYLAQGNEFKVFWIYEIFPNMNILMKIFCMRACVCLAWSKSKKEWERKKSQHVGRGKRMNKSIEWFEIYRGEISTNSCLYTHRVVARRIWILKDHIRRASRLCVYWSEIGPLRTMLFASSLCNLLLNKLLYCTMATRIMSLHELFGWQYSSIIVFTEKSKK